MRRLELRDPHTLRLAAWQHKNKPKGGIGNEREQVSAFVEQCVESGVPFRYFDKIGDKRCGGIKPEGNMRRDGVDVGTDGDPVHYLIQSTQEHSPTKIIRNVKHVTTRSK
jgi:hypothetical protein